MHEVGDGIAGRVRGTAFRYTAQDRAVEENVVAGAAGHCVGSGAADQSVIALATIERIVAATPIDPVIAAKAIQIIAAFGTAQDIVAVGAEQSLDRGIGVAAALRQGSRRD